ncbi:MAG: RNA degradosome polyphosphate kinase [Actinomycetota bacterium]
MTETSVEVVDRYINRELSWLDFDARVLALAEDPTTPLLERAKFLAIFAENLDEFYMVRVAGLKRQHAAGFRNRSPEGLTPLEQLDAIAAKALPLVQHHAHLFTHDVLPALREAGVEVLRWGDLGDLQRKRLDELFRERIFPVVTPLAVGPGHPFPYISNQSLNLAVLVRNPAGGRKHFARVKVPPLLPRFLSLSEESVFVPLEDAIAANLGELFPGMTILEHHAFRVTRNADFEVSDDEAEDLLRALEEELRRTSRFSPAVRLEVESTMSEWILDLLKNELEIGDTDIHSLEGPLDQTGLWNLYEIDRPDLKDDGFTPVTPARFSEVPDKSADVFSIIREQDVLVHHPYESFAATVQRFIEQAAADPNVLAIKQTLYRTSGESPIVEALIDAAEAGKQVVVLVEVKARFDERANITWARTLERAGCHVVYGLVGLKTHCKQCLVVRQEEDALRRYVHVGTGNYNTITANIYEDLGVLTTDPAIGSDVSDLYNFLTGYSRQKAYESLLVAPERMREELLRMIENEAAMSTPENPGRVMIKVNNLVDAPVIDALYGASRAGVKIDLIVRSVCSLRPGVAGLSENIGVRSILGRFLEHSRIFFFRNAGDEQILIGSADLMPRNLDRRVETLVRIKSAEVKERITSLLSLALSDNCSAWTLGGEGEWTRVEPLEGELRLDLQKELARRAAEGA